jgi:anti-sigma regulatory factor (Ser/Thr protein kinase)
MNEMPELDTLIAAVAVDLAGHAVPERAAYAVNLAIEELIVNVIHYAYVDDETHRIDVELAIEGEQIVLRIDDDGMPFDPRKSPVLNVHAEDRQIGGLGLILVLDMVDVLKYRREGGKNRVEVRIRLAAENDSGAMATPAGDAAL